MWRTTQGLHHADQECLMYSSSDQCNTSRIQTGNLPKVYRTWSGLMFGY